MIDNPEAYTLVMRIIDQHNPSFMERMKDQTEVTLRQAIYHHPRTAKLGARIKAVLTALG